MIKYFEFENEIENVEKILNQLNDNKELNADRIKKLNEKKDKLYKQIYSNLDAWQKVQVSRHGDRPHTLDYIKNIFNDVILLHGDKKYADDKPEIPEPMTAIFINKNYAASSLYSSIDGQEHTRFLSP